MDTRFPIHGRRQRRVLAGLVVGAMFLITGCTDSDGDGAALTTTSTAKEASAPEPEAPRKKVDIASFAGGTAADPAGVWLPQDSRLVRLDNTGAVVRDSQPAPPDRRGLGAAGLMTAGAGALFVASSSGLDPEGSEPAVFGWLARLDPRTGKVEATHRITDGTAGSPLSISVGLSGLWATTGTSLVRFDPGTLEKATVFDTAPPAGTGYGTVAVGDGAVYAANAASGRVVRFDLLKEQVTHEAEVGLKAGALPVIFTGSAVWAGGQDELVELDPANLSVRRRVAAPAANELAYYGDDLWNYAQDGLYVLRGSGTTVNRVANLGGSGHFGGLAIGGRYAWLGDYPNQALWRVDIGGSGGLAVATEANGDSAGQRLAVKLGCENQAWVMPAAEDAPPPVETIDCNVGDAQLSVRTYDRPAAVQEAVKALNASRGCGYRALGETWIVAVNTPESAAAAAKKLGGRVVELDGC